MAELGYQNVGAKREYEFWLTRLSQDNPQSPYVTLTSSDVLRAHFHLIDHFSEQGVLLGGIGPRDVNLLESTISRQFSGYGGHQKWDNQWLVIATLFFGIVRKHLFHDANKRTALLSMLYHLESIGKCILLSDQELEDFTVDLANHKLERHRKPQHRNKQFGHVDDEVKFIARWIRRTTRNVDNDYRDISYQKLKTILNNYGYDIVNPQSNHIHLVKIKKKENDSSAGEKLFLWKRGFVELDSIHGNRQCRKVS